MEMFYDVTKLTVVQIVLLVCCRFWKKLNILSRLRLVSLQFVHRCVYF